MRAAAKATLTAARSRSDRVDEAQLLQGGHSIVKTDFLRDLAVLDPKHRRSSELHLSARRRWQRPHEEVAATIRRSQVSPQKPVNQRPTIALLSLSFDMTLFLPCFGWFSYSDISVPRSRSERLVPRAIRALCSWPSRGYTEGHGKTGGTTLRRVRSSPSNVRKPDWSAAAAAATEYQSLPRPRALTTTPGHRAVPAGPVPSLPSYWSIRFLR